MTSIFHCSVLQFPWMPFISSDHCVVGLPLLRKVSFCGLHPIHRLFLPTTHPLSFKVGYPNNGIWQSDFSSYFNILDLAYQRLAQHFLALWTSWTVFTLVFVRVSVSAPYFITGRTRWANTFFLRDMETLALSKVALANPTLLAISHVRSSFPRRISWPMYLCKPYIFT